MTLKKDVHPGIHTATTSVFSDTAKTRRQVTIRKHVQPGILHTATKNPCLVTRQKKSTFIDVVSFTDAQKRRAPRHSHSHKAVFSGMAKKSAFSDAAAFSDAQKTCAPRYSHSHDKSVFSSQRFVTLQRLVTLVKDAAPAFMQPRQVRVW